MEIQTEQADRYSRQIILQQIGIKGQKKLINSKVLVIGCGGIGSPVIMYLAAAGIGTLGIIDGDIVELSNLQRQIIHSTPDIGKPKVISAKETINALNPNVNVIAINDFVTANNIPDVIADYDFVIDAADGFSTKLLINDACVLSKKPYSMGGVTSFDGITSIITPGNACFRCIFTKPRQMTPPQEDNPRNGIIGAICGVIGTLQATECIKYLLGKSENLDNQLLIFSGLTTQLHHKAIKKNHNCLICGKHSVINQL